MGSLVLRPNSTIAWTRFDGTPETLPPEGRPVLVYTCGDGNGYPGVYALGRDGVWGLVWQNPDFQDIQGDVMAVVEVDDCLGLLPENPLRVADDREIAKEDFSYERIGV